MTDFSVWEAAPFGATVDHILQRYHNVHRAQFEELVPLAQKVAQVHADTFPRKLRAACRYAGRAADAYDEGRADAVSDD